MGGSMSADTITQASVTHTPDGRKITEVAVGVLVQPDGRFLLAQRPEGKPYAGYWEFPGGKLESGESVEAALTRELKEELDITLRACERWHTIEHDYPHAYVRLHFCKVTAWDGALRALEGQDFAWQTLPISVDPVLPATLPVFEWMRVEAGAS
ncbi:NUDIX domain-containing protein [Ralstonia pseudosolanacearum]|uniref:NUDIX domain-containing protein n=1 Tax=Ralstonia pseudosolanacearum TaxID=1310165 RepID=UPI0004908BFF|nr:NUDIX domain-containing protein [Ralstonia pseudosolanacearum]MCD9230061.1 NUDIX domain-containing protein [Ralstonia pseudosolanacearum]MCK4123893.1 NUDIX domain-containing protein [Ralstonia pseudosolanacearum]